MVCCAYVARKCIAGIVDKTSNKCVKHDGCHIRTMFRHHISKQAHAEYIASAGNSPMPGDDPSDVTDHAPVDALGVVSAPGAGIEVCCLRCRASMPIVQIRAMRCFRYFGIAM